VSLPDSWAARGVPPGVGWYRTQFSLNLPPRTYVPIAVQVGGPGPGAGTANYRTFIFVNGWLIGRYINNVGPQHQFYVPAGILNDHGPNTLAVAVWGLDATGGGLDQVSLVAEGNQAGGVPVFGVDSPGYDPQVYGPPAVPQPTLAAIPSTALAQGTFTVKATLTNPAFRPLGNASVSLTPPSSAWTVSPSAPASLGTVAPGSSASVTFTVTAPSSGLTPGLTGLLATAAFSAGGSGQSQARGRILPDRGQTQTLINTAQVNVPAPNLAATFNNTSVTDNSNTNPSPGFEGFDGTGTTYSAQGLATAGLTPGGPVTAAGLTFTWPSEPSAQPNNTMAQGQTIAISGSGVQPRVPGRGQQLGRVGHRPDLLHRRHHPAVHAERGQLLVPAEHERKPAERPGGVRELRQLPDRLLGAPGVCVRAVGADRSEQDHGRGHPALARGRGRLQPGAAHIRDVNRVVTP